MNWNEKKTYVNNLVDISKAKRAKNESRRSNTLTYHLRLNNDRLRVCKNMFLNTLSLKEWTVRSWTILPAGKRPFPVTKDPNLSLKRTFVKQFLDSLPKLPSHYCRASSNKLYLEPVFNTQSQLYNTYKIEAEQLLQPVASRKVFDSVFFKENLGIFNPKKDECNICCGFKTKNISEKEYNVHIDRKNTVRAEKCKDKTLALNGEIHLITADLQALKLCPKLNASAAYYKTKLAVHNFTIYNLATKDVMCYWFDETEGDLKSSSFTNFYIDYITSILCEDPKPVVIYTDGCTYQNRNTVLSNALLRLAMEYKVDIFHKYLEKGHTQMEVDSVHSVIERILKNQEIYLPSHFHIRLK
ncbi:uncharacterized protein LOC118736606 [Rhagoletis pomonella]|uniref:uncharacterized protein LOC118736606 n=1 Tax=Rhagoletis pomonella TaxID=28610 RepID=UPI00177DAD2A|nr:uncharacterized protein LOC118736606 [Rhagoletis pomonella]